MWGNTKESDSNKNGAITDNSGPAPAKTQIFRVKVNGKVYTIEATSKEAAKAIAWNYAQYSK